MNWLYTLGILYAYMQWVEPQWFRLKHVKVTTKKRIPRDFTILHLSDTHFTANNKKKAKFIRSLNTLEPDLIVVTGDIIDNNSGIEPAVEILGDLRAKVGKFAVFGNHDYWDYHVSDNLHFHTRGEKKPAHCNDVERFRARLKSKNIHVLNNEGMDVTFDGYSIHISGTDDPVSQQVDFTRTFKNLSSERFHIMLTHVIDILVEMPRVNLDLVFSGHTHGGQVRLPWIGGYLRGFKMPRRFLDGVHQINGSTACISRGLGATRTLTPRLFCRPEAIFLRVSSL